MNRQNYNEEQWRYVSLHSCNIIQLFIKPYIYLIYNCYGQNSLTGRSLIFGPVTVQLAVIQVVIIT